MRSFKALVWLLLRLLYRIRVTGLRNLPEGAALLTPNHVSYIDAALIAAHINRPVHYAMYWKIHKRLKWIVAPLGAFPIAPKDESPEIYERAFDRIEEALLAGELVCIFPEGMLTRTGQMNEFRNGVKKIVARNSVPIVPVALAGLWGTYFSRKKSGIFKLPDRWMSKITMTIGVEEAPEISMVDLRTKVMNMRTFA